MKTDITKMNRKDFENLPLRTDWNTEVLCDSLVILPTRRKHDSGYMCMDFVAVRKNEAICRVSGCSDVIHFNGIGGYGENWLEKYNTVPKEIPVIDWNVDCLPCGLLRVFSHSYDLKCGAALSSFDLYAVKKEKK